MNIVFTLLLYFGSVLLFDLNGMLEYLFSAVYCAFMGALIASKLEGR